MNANISARLAGLAVAVAGIMVAGEADAGHRSRRGCCRQPVECCATVVEQPCCRSAPRMAYVEERYEPRVHHHDGYDCCGRRACVEHVAMERVRVAMPVEEVVVVSQPAVVDTVCCTW